MSLSLALNTALNGLKTSQNAINVTADNIANIDTEGYSRKVYSQTSLVLQTGLTVGAKSSVNQRQVDEVLAKQLATESGKLQNLDVQNYYLQLIQAQMGTPTASTSLGHNFASIQAALESLAIETDKINAQSSCVDALQAALTQIRTLTVEIQQTRLETDRALESLAEEATEILSELDTLNTHIVRTDTVGSMSSDGLKDRRDNLVARLSEIMDIQTYERSTGETVILTRSGKPLLDNEAHPVSHTAVSATGSLITYSGGQINGIYAGSFDITNEISSGEMAGLITLRDTTLTQMQNTLDELSSQMTSLMNQAYNTGTNFPNMTYQAEGTRTFIDSSAQTINIASGDVKLVIFDESGAQSHSVSLTGELGFTSGSIDDLANVIQTWLREGTNGPKLPTAMVGVTSDGHFKIDLGTSVCGFAFRDETGTTPGCDAAPAAIEFDSDGDGTADKTVQGFSSFFGLNDLLYTTGKDTVYDSKIISSGVGVSSKAGTIYFSDKSNGMRYASVEIDAGDDIRTIADKINSCEELKDKIEAQVVREGAGYRLRIVSLENEQTEITSDGTSNILGKLGLSRSVAGLGSELYLRSDIAKTPSLLCTGTVQYNAKDRCYFISNTDNTTANALASVFTESVPFNSAGQTGATTATLSAYASSIVSNLANDINALGTKISSQSDLVTTLYSKNQEVSGVNLDEELANLIRFQRTYSAAAKAFQTATELLEILDSLV